MLTVPNVLGDLSQHASVPVAPSKKIELVHQLKVNELRA